MATFNGDEGNNTLVGGSDNDLIQGFGGNDFLQGGGGADDVIGGTGNDTIGGNDGADWVRGGTGNDSVTGGSGQDSFAFADFGATNADVLADFSGGWDNIQLDASAFTALGANGRFASGDVRFFAGAGANAAHDADDRIVYNTTTGQLWYDADGSGAGAAQLIATLSNRATINATDIWAFNSGGTPPPAPPGINGTEGNDSLVGTSGNDTINGFGGDDSLVGNEGSDRLNGGDGNDVLHSDGAFSPRDSVESDTLDGGLGNDTYYVFVNDVILADPGGVDNVEAETSWTLGSGLENLRVGGVDADGANAIGNELDNVIDGSGMDHYGTIDGRAGNDLILAGQRNMSSSVVLGGEGNDTIRASSVAADTIFGGAGNDSIVGYDSFRETAAFDVIDGGAGNDTLDGTGFFRFSAAPGTANADSIRFFSSGLDTIQLDGNAFASTGASGRFASGDVRFFSAAGANSGHDADDRVVYDTASGNLWYDADGNGAGTAQLIATLAAGTSLAATDIEILNGGATPPPPPPPPSDGTNGTEGNDTMIGGSANDTLNGLGGNDFIQGGGGADVLRGGAGNDTIGGNDGADSIESGAGNDSIGGGSGLDMFVFREFGAGNADMVGDFSGNNWDSIRLDAAAFSALGASGRFATGDVRFHAAAGATAGHNADDRIVYNTTTGQLFYDADGSGAGSAELIATLANRAAVRADDVWVIGSATPPPPPPPPPSGGTEGDDTLLGTSGNDNLSGLGGNDSLVGFEGHDTLDGGSGVDTMNGGPGNDLYFVDSSSDQVVELEDAGIDEVRSTVSFSLPSWVNDLMLIGSTATAGTGNSIDNVITGNALNNDLQGLDGNDTIAGGDGFDNIIGGAGNDRLLGGNDGDIFWQGSFSGSSPGNDFIDGGAAGQSNWVDYRGAQSNIVANLNAGTVTGGGGGGAGQATVVNIDHVFGTGFGDLLLGNASGNALAGADGDDTINGGGGFDNLQGGNGADHFIISDAPGSGQRPAISDFQTAIDKLHLDASLMPALGPSGNFAPDDPRFYAAAGANAGHDADDRVVYNTSTGQVWYDPDGSGGAAAQIIVHLPQSFPEPPATLVASDIVVDNGSATPRPPPPSDGTNGTEANDTMIGGAANDTLNGLGGNDFIQGGGGADLLRGGTGNDTMSGNDGSDQVEGGAGNDRLTGGSSTDAFVFREFGAANADVLTDFGGNNWDSIRLDNAAFTALGGDGRFASGDARFFAAAGATGGHDADDRIVYNTSTGQLYYDADGSGAGGAELIATLQAGATLVASDVWVI